MSTCPSVLYSSEMNQSSRDRRASSTAASIQQVSADLSNVDDRMNTNSTFIKSHVGLSACSNQVDLLLTNNSSILDRTTGQSYVGNDRQTPSHDHQTDLCNIQSPLPSEPSVSSSSFGSKNFWLKAAIEAKNRRIASSSAAVSHGAQSLVKVDTRSVCSVDVHRKSASKPTSSKEARSLFESFAQNDFGPAANLPGIFNWANLWQILASQNTGAIMAATGSLAVPLPAAEYNLNAMANTSLRRDLAANTMSIGPHLTCRLIPLVTNASTPVSYTTLTDHVYIAPAQRANAFAASHPSKDSSGVLLSESVKQEDEINSSTCALNSVLVSNPQRKKVRKRKAATRDTSNVPSNESIHKSPKSSDTVDTVISLPIIPKPSSDYSDCTQQISTNLPEDSQPLCRVPPLKLLLVKNSDSGDDKIWSTQQNVKSGDPQTLVRRRAAHNQNACCSVSESALGDMKWLSDDCMQLARSSTVLQETVIEKQSNLTLVSIKTGSNV